MIIQLAVIQAYSLGFYFVLKFLDVEDYSHICEYRVRDNEKIFDF